MPNPTNLEMIVAPFEVYITTGSDSFPSISATPAGGWTLMGKNGKRNTSEGGVTVYHDQVIQMHRVEGHTEPVKASRTSEDFRVTFGLTDFRGDMYQHALNAGGVDTSGTTDVIPLGRSLEVQEVKVLVRGPSPLVHGLNSQYEVTRAVQTGSPSFNPHKGGMGTLDFEFTALGDPDASATGERIGRLLYDKS